MLVVNKKHISERTLEQALPHPTANGSFIQLDMTYDWDEHMWDKELQYLKQAGMDYMVAMGAAVTDNDSTKTVYPSELKFCSMHTKQDVLELMLKSAQSMGIKVFIGLDYNNAWWSMGSKNRQWLFKQVARGNLIAEELYKRYHDRYTQSFFGWYWMYEVDNMSFRTKKQFELLSKAINLQLKFMEEKSIRLPFMLSPFMNSLGSSPKAYGENWVYVFQHTDLGRSDVFGPQDSVGGGGIKQGQAASWFKAFREAVNTKPGLLLWANVENFDHSTWGSAPVGRFIEQMQAVAPYVDNIITFSYCHYYSPNNIDIGYHETYLAYVKIGELEQQPPSVPDSISCEKLSQFQCKVNWEAAKDNIGVAAYALYRNNRLIWKTEVQRKYGAKNKALEREYIDNIKGFDKCRKPVYQVAAYDFAGNASVKSKPAQTVPK